MMQKEITSVMGYQRITSLSASTGLTVPATTLDGQAGTPVRAIIRAETQAVRFRDDGTAPTASVGFPLAIGDVLEYDGDLNKIRFIEQTASAVLNVVYYK